jgi:hypothetical protein
LLRRVQGDLALVPKTIQPRPDLAPPALKSLDSGSLLERKRNVIQAVKQAVSAEWIDGERHRGFAACTADLLLLEIDLELETRLGLCCQLPADILGKGDGQHAVLHAVVAEDVREAGRDNAADAEVVPGQMTLSADTHHPA